MTKNEERAVGTAQPACCTGSLEEAVQTLLNIPESERETQAFGMCAGLTMGRALAVDKKRTARELDLDSDFARLYSVVSHWTICAPEITGVILQTMDPAMLFVILEFWPEEHLRGRVFFAGVLLGMYYEGYRGTDFLRTSPEYAESLLAMTEWEEDSQYAEDSLTRSQRRASQAENQQETQKAKQTQGRGAFWADSSGAMADKNNARCVQ